MLRNRHVLSMFKALDSIFYNPTTHSQIYDYGHRINPCTWKTRVQSRVDGVVLPRLFTFADDLGTGSHACISSTWEVEGGVSGVQG